MRGGQDNDLKVSTGALYQKGPLSYDNSPFLNYIGYINSTSFVGKRHYLPAQKYFSEQLACLLYK